MLKGQIDGVTLCPEIQYLPEGGVRLLSVSLCAVPGEHRPAVPVTIPVPTTDADLREWRERYKALKPGSVAILKTDSAPEALIVEHQGFEIKVWRAPSLGGDELLYFTVVRKADGWFLVDSFSTGSDTLEDFAGYLKERVDAYLADPASECDEHSADVRCSACKILPKGQN